ncbi:MAG: hypothetical protein ACREA0_34180 [bacterium]
MAKTPTYRLKINRAAQHFEEVKRLVAEYESPRPYKVTHRIEGKEKLHVYRAYPAEEPDPWLAIVIGDLLFDLRSGLDHLRVALAGRKYRNEPGFPIFTEDIWETDSEGKYLERTAGQRQIWEQSTRGMSERAKVEVDKFQPFRQPEEQPFPGREGVLVRREDTTLAILSRLNNADKHRELVTVVNYVEPRVIRYHFPEGMQEISISPQAHAVGGHGTVIARLDREVKVEAIGALRVAMGSREFPKHPGYELPVTLEVMISHIGSVMFDSLEPFVRSS